MRGGVRPLCLLKSDVDVFRYRKATAAGADHGRHLAVTSGRTFAFILSSPTS